MKLPDFIQDSWMNNLRSIIGANLNENYKWEHSWDPLVLKLIQDGELWNLNLSDVWVSNDGTLEYGWIKIVVYIRDQNSRGFNFTTNESNYKFHFYNCSTISSYRKEQKFDWKYVANRNKNFNVNVIDYWEIKKENLELSLNVCKNCLNEFSYKWYNRLSHGEKSKIYENFTRTEYFNHFKTLVKIPKYNYINKPKDIYAENWITISRKAKERAGYTCMDCWSIKKLQTHHKNHNKWDNSPANLEVLCYDCHAKHHAHM